MNYEYTLTVKIRSPLRIENTQRMADEAFRALEANRTYQMVELDAPTVTEATNPQELPRVSDTGAFFDDKGRFWNDHRHPDRPMYQRKP